MTSTTKQMRPNGKRGEGKYWQLNQSNQHSSIYNRILCDNTQWICKRKSYDKSVGQTEDHVPWSCLPQGDLPTVHSHYTRRSSALPEGPLGGLPSLSLTTEGSWSHLGGGSPNHSSAHWRQYPQQQHEGHAACKKLGVGLLVVTFLLFYSTSYMAPVVSNSSVTLICNKIQNGDILVLANSGSPGKMTVKVEEWDRTKEIEIERERERERERYHPYSHWWLDFSCWSMHMQLFLTSEENIQVLKPPSKIQQRQQL